MGVRGSRRDMQAPNVAASETSSLIRVVGSDIMEFMPMHHKAGSSGAHAQEGAASASEGLAIRRVGVAFKRPR
jgi:hypothetical protein